MRVDGGEKQANLSRASHQITRAAKEGAQLALLPEAMTLGWTHASARASADEIPNGESCQVLGEAAVRNKVHVCAGLIERAGDQIFNSAVLINPDGEILLHYRKLNELEIGHHLYALGDRLQVVDTALGRFGLMICADGFARGQVISRTLGYMGAQMILSPSAWAVPADHDNLRQPYGKLWTDNYSTVARDFKMWIAGVSNVGWITDGPWKGRKCIGCSLVIGPDGRPVLAGPYGVDADVILTLDVELQARPAQGDGWSRVWSPVQPGLE
jgi:predicted amidohydrolase